MNRRHFLFTMGAGSTALTSVAGRGSAAGQPEPGGVRMWIDPRYDTMPRRPWRKVHLDFHNSKHVAKIGERFDADAWGDQLVAAHVDSIVVFAKDMHGHFYYPSRYGPVHPGLSFDLLGAQVQACRRRGIAVYAYYCTTWDHHLAGTRGDWLVIRRDGSNYLPGPGQTPGWTALCLAHEPFLKLINDHTRELVSRYELHGAWFDMAEPIAPECFCPECKRQIAAAGGDPNEAAVQRAHKNRLFLEFHRRMRDLVKSVRPGCQVDFNDIGLSCVGERAPLLDNIDIEALPTGDWGYFYAPGQIRYQRTFGIPVYGMTGRFVISWADFGGLTTPTQLDVELASIVANCARCDVGDQMPPSGRLDPAVYHVIGKSYARIEKLEPWLEGAAPVTEAAMMIPAVPLERLRDEYLYGATKLMLESRLQFDVVEPGQDWERYGLVVLPDELSPDAKTVERLRAFVAAGGAVVAFHKAGLAAEAERSWLGANGIEYAGVSPFKPAYLVPQVPLAQDLPAYEYALYDGSLQWRAGAGVKVLARLGEPAFQRSAERYTSHRQSPFDHTTEYAVAAVSGRVGLIGFPVGLSYYRQGYWVYRAMFEQVLHAIGLPRLVETNAPLSTEITVTRQAARRDLRRPERYLVHIVNWSPVRKAPPHPETHEDPIPLTDIRVRLNLPLGVVSARTVIAGEKLGVRRIGSGLEFTVPRVRTHEAVCLQRG